MTHSESDLRSHYLLTYLDPIDKAIRSTPPYTGELRQGIKDALGYLLIATVAFEQYGISAKELFDGEAFQQITDACEATIKLLLEPKVVEVRLAQSQPATTTEE